MRAIIAPHGRYKSIFFFFAQPVSPSPTPLTNNNKKIYINLVETRNIHVCAGTQVHDKSARENGIVSTAQRDDCRTPPTSGFQICPETRRRSESATDNQAKLSGFWTAEHHCFFLTFPFNQTPSPSAPINNLCCELTIH